MKEKCKIKCKLCNTIVEGDNKGHLIWCECHSCGIDETPYYCRLIGNFENYEIIKEEK